MPRFRLPPFALGLLLAACWMIVSAAEAVEVFRTPNFMVYNDHPGTAEAVAETAEYCRRELALSWLGRELPDWSAPCEVRVTCTDHVGDGGATSFIYAHNTAEQFTGTWQGKPETILQDVVPHEVLHCILATHFGRPLPRWLDEGLASMMESQSSRAKYHEMLVTFLRGRRGIPFNTMFALAEYPPDIMPLFVQGHSLVAFLLSKGDQRALLNFTADGLNQGWPVSLKRHYGFDSLGSLQNAWVSWVADASATRTVYCCRLRRLFQWIRPRCVTDPAGRRRCIPGGWQRLQPQPGQIGSRGATVEANGKFPGTPPTEPAPLVPVANPQTPAPLVPVDDDWQEAGAADVLAIAGEASAGVTGPGLLETALAGVLTALGSSGPPAIVDDDWQEAGAADVLAIASEASGGVTAPGLLETALPGVLTALGWTGPPTIAAMLGLKILGGLIRRRRKREKEGGEIPNHQSPVVIHEQSPPPPQLVRRHREFVAYQKPNGRLQALEMAFDEYVRRHPGARSTVESIEAYADQYESGLKSKQLRTDEA